MQGTLEGIFQIEDLKEVNLSEHEDLLRQILDEHVDEIEQISKMDDKQLEDSLAGLLERDNTLHFKSYLANLLYIKQSYFIEKKEQEEVTKIDIEALKELKLEELINMEGFQGGTDIQISFQKIQELAKIKNEEDEKWKEYNIVNTVSELAGIPETSIKFISNLSEYIAFVSELSSAVNYVSRGQKDCTFDLAPSLHRRHSKDYEIHSSIYEGAFKQKIIYYDKEIKNKSDEELRAEGQHFGLPTDYLDFTEAHMISLLFAIEDYDYIKQHSVVYFIDSVAYNNESVGQREKLIDYSDPTVIETMRRFSSRSYFIKLGNSNERIHFQKGCFLKVSVQDREEFRRKLSTHCKIAIINKEAKKNILKELFSLGITFENIYPDKDNVVKSIKFHYEEMQGGSY